MRGREAERREERAREREREECKTREERRERGGREYQDRNSNEWHKYPSQSNLPFFVQFLEMLAKSLCKSLEIEKQRKERERGRGGRGGRGGRERGGGEVRKEQEKNKKGKKKVNS
jgi:hypothetical protein